jgi:short-subunit dehydrogenase
MNLVLAARSEGGLDAVAEEVRATAGVTVSTLVVDLADRAQTAGLAQRAIDAAGRIDVLVNNAGLEFAYPPEEADLEDLAMIVDVNLLAPMLLTRTMLPAMIERRRGHIVNISSMAGLLATAYQVSYNATKFGLVGYTRSLRMSAQDRGWNVSASVICPGFMAGGGGMYETYQDQFGVTAPKFVGDLPAGKVGVAVLDAVERDLPDVLIAHGAPRATAAVSTVAPRLFERLAGRADLAAPFRTVALHRSAQRRADG